MLDCSVGAGDIFLRIQNLFSKLNEQIVDWS